MEMVKIIQLAPMYDNGDDDKGSKDNGDEDDVQIIEMTKNVV